MPRNYRHQQPTIGVLAGWQFAWTATPLSYLDPIYRGICLAAQDLGCNVLLGCGMGSWTSGSDSMRPAWPLSSSECDFVPIGPWNTDGLIVVNPLHSQVRSRYVQDLITAGHPVIFIASGERGPTIVADNRSGVLEAMGHLVEHGHRCIAFIAGSQKDIEGDSGERLLAYQEAVEMHGLPADPRLIAWGQHVYDGGMAAMQEVIASGISFTAVLASNDESALGAMQALQQLGKRIPKDVAIIGFDDRPESAVQVPALSSVRIPLRQMGYRAFESLFRYLTGQTDTIESARLATRLEARESCGCNWSAFRSIAPNVATPRHGLQNRETDLGELARTMAAPILASVQGLSFAEIEALCQRLAETFYTGLEHSDSSGFEQTLEAILRRVDSIGDDPEVWQAAISTLGEASSTLPAASFSRAREMLDRGHLAISTSMQRRFRRHQVDRRWELNRLGTLAARLLAALDETRIYEVLADHLPAMGVDTTWIALFGAEGDDPIAWTTLRAVTAVGQPALRFRSREFPPPNLLPVEQPFRLALFPLTGPRGQLGYVAFDTAHLSLYGAIAQELATALNSAQLHREATEGRRLAEEANELKGRFLSTVSHELRTPLNLIVGLSGILLQAADESDTPLPESYRKDMEQIFANAQHLGALIGDVLDLASSDAGQLRLTSEFVDLGEVLRQVAEMGRQLAHQKGLKWHADLPKVGPCVWGDRTRLRQIVLNLINNAVKFTAQGQVSLRLESGPDSVTVAVCDTGLGVPPEEQSLIFEEFRCSERSIAHGYESLGLGLAICKRLVELHGGTIGVYSTGQEGAGSTFYFTLPTAQRPVAPTQCPALSPLEERILVLTHRASSSQRLQEVLTEHGFVVEAVFVDETPDWLSQLVLSPPSAVVIDVSAAAQQVWSVLKSIKAHPRTKHLNVMLCLLSPDRGSVLDFDYLTKPIELAELTRALDQHWLAPDADHPASTILIVDDDLDTLEMHARIVHAHSPTHRVLTAQNGLEAVGILQREHIDLVLLDLIMPELDGFGVLEAMREREATRKTPVIVLTGQVLTERDMARLNQGVATVLNKGLFSLEETLTHLEATLDRRRKLCGEAQRLVRQAMAYIHEHYADPISRADIARHVALSDDYLTSCFRKELGVTPIAYVNRVRVNRAKQLLGDPRKSITEIALEVGFSDSGYFSRVFRREVGIPPEAYRQA